MSSIVVKAYWKKWNGERAEVGEEIRRFSVDQDVLTSYSYLTEKIRLAFPSLLNREFILFWKDSDGDLITFSNDDDLMDALSHNVDKDLFRIYIEDVKPMSSQCPPASGYRCAPAGGNRCPPAGGNRCPPAGGYKCPPAGEYRCPPASFAGPHLGVMCDGCDGPIFGTRFKCVVCPDYDLCTPCRSTGLHGEHQFTNIENPPFQKVFAEAMTHFQQATTSGCSNGPCGERGQPDWNGWWKMPAQQNMFAEVMKHFQQATASGCSNGPCGERGQPDWNGWWKMPAQQNPNPQDKGNPSTASAAEGAKESECGGNDHGEQWKKDQQEFVKNIGAFAAGILNPFGFTSESDAKLKKEEAGSSSGQSGKKEMRSDQSQEGGCRGREAGGCQSGNRTSGSGNAPEEAKPSTSPTHSTEKGQSHNISRDSSTTSNNMDTEDQADTAGQTTSSSNEQAVRACLQTLKEMGFSDEGGWLTSLVNVYQGIVTHVLDAIQANQNQ